MGEEQSVQEECRLWHSTKVSERREVKNNRREMKKRKKRCNDIERKSLGLLHETQIFAYDSTWFPKNH